MAVMVALGSCIATVAYAIPPSLPSSIEVAVSYADTEGRPGAGNCTDCSPAPWCGSPNVQFIGSSTNYNGNPTDASNCMGGDWDGGAILVTNAGSALITLTNLTVTLPLPASGGRGSPSCAEPPRPITFNLWFGEQYYYGNKSTPAYHGGPITIPAGGQAIFTGTSSDGSYTCPTGNYPSGPKGGTYDFDTSDANFLGGCTPTTDTLSDPQITFWATGYDPTTYLDKGHVIDTGGIDTGNCAPISADPQWGHEWLGWRVVSSVCGENCPSNQFGAAPTTAAVPGPSTTATASGASGGVTATTAYGIAAIAVTVIVAAGYFAVRRRKPSKN